MKNPFRVKVGEKQETTTYTRNGEGKTLGVRKTQMTATNKFRAKRGMFQRLFKVDDPGVSSAWIDPDGWTEFE